MSLLAAKSGRRRQNLCGAIIDAFTASLNSFISRLGSLVIPLETPWLTEETYYNVFITAGGVLVGE